MNLREYCLLYARMGYPRDFRLMQRVYETDVSASTLVWQDGLFLVEQYFMFPKARVVPHSHPFESATIFMAGQLAGTREGNMEQMQWLTAADMGTMSEPLPAGQMHAFVTGETGAVIFVLSHWANEEEMNSATVKYLGEPLGVKHAKTLMEQTR